MEKIIIEMESQELETSFRNRGEKYKADPQNIQIWNQKFDQTHNDNTIDDQVNRHQ
jgi:hypothetical protein